MRFLGARSCIQKEGNSKYKLLVLLFEYIDGGNLQQCVGQCSKKLVIQVARHIAEALKYLHTRTPPIIHQDVKMENILYDRSEDRWKLCDFGSARRLVGNSVRRELPAWEIAHQEHALAALTTKAYRPPECVDVYSYQRLTTKADVWMYGCVLFAICFGRLPFGTDASVLAVLSSKGPTLDLRPSEDLKEWVVAWLTPPHMHASLQGLEARPLPPHSVVSAK
eukprot:Blabericola_migrator_1__11223@NODE_659_length_7014_cov_89_107672_g36_i1_p4_GENE_NODE_659_length_7014_cov_89_107672_g36_i1NODE_659_length_7014_cov_89_107672_g36_i1_p4_ORF_typecomplete_len222_score24_22Pkinase/PF00069_25/1_9e32Pkinase_Tyr/PF07714_17/6_9e25Kinaselike/PF14531_6/3_6e11Kdo/PF06293_14/8_8e08Pkinase_fungal/PF17667_1/5_1e06WaaY/PF06176_11/3_4e05APH/PF01636_23/0_0014EcKinase/PF02958_20/0_0086RIO1/PF01163_22/0_063FTA2/PF13095_6/0_2Choline_kinase/PF01633_20/7_7e02Choline_kinase/PF01633_20/0